MWNSSASSSPTTRYVPSAAPRAERQQQRLIHTRSAQIKDATAKIKELADVRTQSMDDVDSLLRVYHSGIQSGELAVGQKEALDRLLRKHREARDASGSRDASPVAA